MTRKIYLSFIPAKECKDPDVWFTCVKCGKCGRKFEDGYMVDSGGTTPQKISEE